MAKHLPATNGAHAATSMVAPTALLRRRAFEASHSMALIVILLTMLVFAHTVAFVSASSRVLDAATGGECVDSDPVNCPFWAATGECNANRKYMHVHCKKSCDRCHVVRVNDHNEMGRIMAERKMEMEEKREQRRKDNEALQALEGGGFGGSDKESNNNDKGGQKKNPTPPKVETAATNTATATISSSGTVETMTTGAAIGESKQDEGEKDISPTKSDAAAAANANANAPQESASSPPTTTKQKPRRKKAKIDVNTGSECVDFDESCPFIAATGECNTRRSFTSANCRLSCDRCHIMRVNSAEEMHNIIKRKQKATERELRERKKRRDAIKILATEL